MKTLTLSEIDEKRKHGLRPQVVGCFVHEQKVFLFYDKKHHLWQFPQGGIENLEETEAALVREMSEELGARFVEQKKNCQLLVEDRINFPEKYWGSRPLRTDEGEKVLMKGKHYYAFAIETEAPSIILQETQFDDYLLASYEQAESLLVKVYQKEKRRIAVRFLEALVSKKLIA